MPDYEITFVRSVKVTAPNPAHAVAKVLNQTQGPDDFILDEIDRVEELTPQPPLHPTIPRKEWR